MKFEGKECAGLFEPCSQPVEHEMPAPDGKGKSIYLCHEHWVWTEELIAKLEADPELSKDFAAAVEEAHKQIN